LLRLRGVLSFAFLLAVIMLGLGLTYRPVVIIPLVVLGAEVEVSTRFLGVILLLLALVLALAMRKELVELYHRRFGDGQRGEYLNAMKGEQ